MSQEEKKGWFSRLKEGLKKTSSQLGEGIVSVLTKRKLDQEALDALEEVLIQADFGVDPSADLIARLKKDKFNQDVTDDDIKGALSEKIQALLEPYEKKLEVDSTKTPHVILVVGVNGSGKTTSIGKLAKFFLDQGKKVSLAAGDTFRAAAVEQLKVWGERNGVCVYTAALNSDPASLAFEALSQAQKKGEDVLLIDTAGRLHNKADLMEELGKINRVLKKVDPSAPHSTILVLDATTGQNAHQQVEVFHKITPLSGLVMTKLDGTARGGVLVSLTQKYKMPVFFIGVGEGVDDLRPFDSSSFAKSLLGVE